MNTKIISILVVIAIFLVGGYLLMNDDKSSDMSENSPSPTVSQSTSPSVSVSPSIFVSPSISPSKSVSSSPSSSTEPTVSSVKSFTVKASNFVFDLKEIKVKKGDTVRITLQSSGMPHDWVVDEISGARTKILQSGQEETIEFKADKSGAFEYYCSVGQHRKNGMFGKLIIE